MVVVLSREVVSRDGTILLNKFLTFLGQQPKNPKKRQNRVSIEPAGFEDAEFYFLAACSCNRCLW